MWYVQTSTSKHLLFDSNGSRSNLIICSYTFSSYVFIIPIRSTETLQKSLHVIEARRLPFLPSLFIFSLQVQVTLDCNFLMKIYNSESHVTLLTKEMQSDVCHWIFLEPFPKNNNWMAATVSRYLLEKISE